MQHGRSLALGAAVAGLLLTAAPAGAAITAKSSLRTAGSKVRLVVRLTSTKRLSARTRPRSVKVRAGSKTYVLAKVRGASAARAYSGGTWQSAAYGGTAGAQLSALAGRRVTVRIGSRAGTTSLSSRLPRPSTTGGGGGGAGGGAGTTPLFEPPGRELSGEETRPFLQRYLVNSRFTDCPGVGWPACSVEVRYNHCPDGSWEYHRLTPTSGSDIHAYGSAQVTAAVVHADGSWVVEYTENGYGTQHLYHWEISKEGRVVGSYDGSQALGPLQYQQPANCGSPY